MKVIAAGSFRLNGQGDNLTYQTDLDHPSGSTPFNIARVSSPATNVYDLEFSVPTERPGFSRFRWYVQGPHWYDTMEMKWINPYQIQIIGSSEFSLLAIQEAPDGSLELPPEFILYGSFDAAGNLLEADPGHPLGAYPSRGFDGNALNYGGAFRTPLNVDFWPACYSWLVWYTPPPGSPLAFPTNSFYTPRLTQFAFNTVPLANWHVAAYRYSDDQPARLYWDSFTPPVVSVGGFFPLTAWVEYDSAGPPLLGTRRTPANISLTATQGATLVSSDPGIASIDVNQTSVTGVSPGLCTATYSWKGLTTTWPFEVV
jgi:hypothetical protein